MKARKTALKSLPRLAGELVLDTRLHIWAQRLIETRCVRNASALIIYMSLSIYFFGMPIISHPSQFYVGMGSDPISVMWCLVWWPHALANHLNPFISRAIWAPTGANLAWTTSMPGPSLLAYPITRLLGPVVAYNFLCLLAPTSAAWAAFCLCHYITNRFWPALLGGYLFGFSTYMLGQMLGHLFLVIVFPIPTVVLLAMLVLDRAISMRRFVILLTLVLSFEFLTSTEVFASTIIFGAFASILALLILPADSKRRIGRVLMPICYACMIAAVLLSQYLYYVFLHGEPLEINSAQVFSADLLNFFLPTPVTLLGHKQFAAVAAHFSGGESAEATSYLGFPLLVVSLVFATTYWSRPWTRLLGLTFLFLCLCSLGPVLHLNGEPTTIALPWAVCGRLPLVDQILPARLSMYAFLIAGVMAALYLSNPIHTGIVRLMIGGLIVLFLWPNVSYFRSVGTSAVETPAFFLNGTYQEYLKRDETVVVLPLGDRDNSRLWQAQTKMYFRTAERQPRKFAGWPALRDLNDGRAGPDFSEQLSAFLGAHQVSSIIVDQRHQDAWPQILSVLGVAPIDTGGVLLYRVPSPVLAAYRNASATFWAQKSALVRFPALISAAHRYISAGLPLAKLTPWEAEHQHLLTLHTPSEPTWEAEHQHLLTLHTPSEPSEPRADRNWQDDLWLGAYGGRDGIGVGILSSYVVVKPLIEKFGPYASEIYFPYPNKLTPGLQAETYGQLLMVFSSNQLDRAAQATKAPHKGKSTR